MDNNNKIVIKCEGISVDKLLIPPFELRIGEYLSLNFPSIYDIKEEQKIISILTAKLPFKGVTVFMPLVAVQEPPYKKKFLKGPLHIFHNGTAKNYLLKHTSYTNEQIISLIKSLDIDPNDKILSLGGNIRKLLALEVAYNQSNHIILNTVGLDPLGVEEVYSRIESQLQSGSVIELNYQTSLGRTHFNTSKMVNLVESY